MVDEKEEELEEEEEEEEAMAMEDKLQENITDKKSGQKGKKGKKKKKKRKKKTTKNSSKKDYKDYKLVSYGELPDYMKENEFIRRYYRSEWPISHAFLSLFSWHNETLNVWTHLLGFFVFLGLMMMHLRGMPHVDGLLRQFPWSITSKSVENASVNQGNLFSVSSLLINLDQTTSSPTLSGQAAPRWPFLVFLAGAMICLLTSSLCHLLCCHSRSLNLLLSRLDYAGIAAMIAASFFPPISYAFLCAPCWSLLYLSVISFLAVTTVVSLLSPSRGDHRGFRALLFAGMGLTGIVPSVHIAAANWSEERWTETVAWEVAMAGLYLVGTGFYMSRVPERWRPGRFDLAGHSHQIFHVFVVAGALAHYAAALLFLEWRDKVGCGRR